MIAYETVTASGGLNNRLLVRRFAPSGACLGGPVTAGNAVTHARHLNASLGINANGDARLNWQLLAGGTCSLLSGPDQFVASFSFLDFAAPAAQTPPFCVGLAGGGDEEPSVGVSDLGWVQAWMRIDARAASNPSGLMVQVSGGAAGQLVPCTPPEFNPPPYCHYQWQPCVAVDADGRFCVAYAVAESSEALPPFDIALVQFDPGGVSVGSANPVNQETSPFSRDDLSPAAAMRGESIVVAWSAGRPFACATGGPYRVFARQYRWQATGPVAVSPAFIVNNHEIADVSPPSEAHPTVSIHATGQTSRHLIAWNAIRPGDGQDREVRASYFDFATSQPLGDEFRLHRTDELTEAASGERHRALAGSAQHALGFAQDGSAIATWSASLVPSAAQVWFTRLPPDAPRQSCCGTGCCRGDFDGNGLINGEDIQYFNKIYINRDWFTDPWASDCVGFAAYYPAKCSIDIDGNCMIDAGDVSAFVCLLLWDPPNYYRCTSCDMTCPGGQGTATAHHGEPVEPSSDLASRLALWDCNDNGAPDGRDIAAGVSADCNANGRPDECDLAFDPRTLDCNENGVPDECETMADGSPLVCPSFVAAAASTLLDPEPAQVAFGAWLASFDERGLRPWEFGYRVKIELTRLGLRYR